jgi:hypothetical protein
MNDDFKNIGLVKKAKGPDYFTKLWEDEQKRDRNLKQQLVNVRVRKGESALLGRNTIVLMVQVFSQNLKGRAKQAEKEMNTGHTMSELRTAAGLMAGALAEMCCNDFGDTYDPSEYARLGVEAFDQIVRRLQDGELTVGTITE